MSKIVLQPNASKEAKKNYNSMMQNGVSVAGLHHVSVGQRNLLNSLASDGFVRLWGVMPGETGRNQSRWERVSPGDYLLFARGGDTFTIALILDTIQNPDLARELWGTGFTKNGIEQTWELIMILGEPSDLPLLNRETLNSLIGHNQQARVQEFGVLDEGESARVINTIGLKHEGVTTGGVENTVDDVSHFEGLILDKEGIASYRAEQGQLRESLIRNGGNRCVLCERVFPSAFLFAAHIHPRSKLTDEEKADLANVAMLNCSFGCDALWGLGYIGVDGSGYLRWSPQAPNVGPVYEYMKSCLHEGKKVNLWENTPGTQKYFKAHYSQEFKR